MKAKTSSKLVISENEEKTVEEIKKIFFRSFNFYLNTPK